VTSSFAPAQDQASTAPPPCPPALVEELFKLLAKAVRAFQLYLPNNPMYQRAMDQARAAFGPIWEATDHLRLVVSEHELRWEGQVVDREESKTESLAWVFYKDGIRELTITRGFEDTEMVALLEIVQRVKKAAPEEDDLLTLLWEQDFLHLRYQFVDLTSESASPLETALSAERPTVAPPEAQQSTEARPEMVRLEEFDSTLYFLDEHEIEYLRSQVQAEYATDLRRNVLAILLDVFELQGAPTVREEVAGILDSFMVHLLAAGDFRSVAYLLRETAVTLARARELDASVKRRLEMLPDRLGSSRPKPRSALLARW
jgi:hypothetical protein